MVELHEKYQDAMKKLQEYFDNSMTKVHEVNSQKKATLRVPSFKMNSPPQLSL